MFRWLDVEDQDVLDMTVKMYREPYIAATTYISPYKGLELDHYAYRHLKSELLLYQILDINFVNYMEERGDMSEIDKVYIPATENTEDSIL